MWVRDVWVVFIILCHKQHLSSANALHHPSRRRSGIRIDIVKLWSPGMADEIVIEHCTLPDSNFLCAGKASEPPISSIP